MLSESRPPFPPFTRETALEKVQAAEDTWMARREASINDVRIDEPARRIFGARPESERGDEFPLR